MLHTRMARYQSYQTRPSILRRLIKWCFVLGLWATLILGAVLAWYAKDLPNIIENPKFDRKASITVMANDHSVIARYGDIKGNNIGADNIPETLANAILATEDRRFYYHYGLDPIGLARAIFVNFTHKGVVQGGSTITQQLAKNLFLSQERTLKRKIQEAMLAVWLEHKLTKKEILAAYMNRVYLGSGIYGAEAAAQIYFGKDVHKLNLKESAMLAGLLKAPARYSPLADPDAADKRARVVLGAMVDAGMVTEKQAKWAASVKIARTSNAAEDKASHYYADWVVDSLEAMIGVPTDDIIVETTMDPEVQESTAKVLKDAIDKNGKKFNVTQAASVVLRPDGSIIAIVGGIDYSKSQFNRATQGLRQPGSSFKPFVYLSAIEHGANEYTDVLDEPITEGKYRPQNFGNKYYGEVPMIEALTWSLNSVAVRLCQAVGVESVINVARRMGITADLVPNLSLALGSSEVPMIEMAQAYATINSGGYAVRAYGIEKIRDAKTGQILYEYEKTPAPRVFRGGDIQTLTNMMMSVVQNGTGQGAKAEFFSAGKTGTSQDYRDAWFDGFSRDYVAVVWFGNDDNRSMKSVTGGSLPATAWRNIIVGAKNDATPSKYALLKDDSMSSDFTDLLGNLVSSPFPESGEQPHDNRGGNGFSFTPSPRFEPDHPGDNVGYKRFND